MARERNYASFGVISAERGHNLSRMGAQYDKIWILLVRTTAPQ
jgi:hypothetical protein